MAANRSTDTLTINEAAKHSGKSATTIRRWLESGVLKYKTSPEGWKLITKDDLLGVLSENTTVTSPPERATQHVAHIESSTVTVLKESLEHERRRCERLEAEKNDLQKNIKELQGELLKLTKETQAILQKQTGITSWFRGKGL